VDYRKKLLLLSAARLYSVGGELELARDRLRVLVEQNVPFDALEMREAYDEFRELESQWNDLEAQHLALRAEIDE
jgi:hypothetical protein